MAVTERFTWMGMTVSTIVEIIDGKPVFMVECAPEVTDELSAMTPIITTAWTAGFNHFGVEVDDDMIYPPESEETS